MTRQTGKGRECLLLPHNITRRQYNGVCFHETSRLFSSEIRSRLQSRSSPRVFSHQKPSASRHSARPQTQQSLYVPPAEVLEPAAVRPPSHQSITSQQSVIRSILSYKPQQNN